MTTKKFETLEEVYKLLKEKGFDVTYYNNEICCKKYGGHGRRQITFVIRMNSWKEIELYHEDDRLKVMKSPNFLLSILR